MFSLRLKTSGSWDSWYFFSSVWGKVDRVFGLVVEHPPLTRKARVRFPLRLSHTKDLTRKPKGLVIPCHVLIYCHKHEPPTWQASGSLTGILYTWNTVYKVLNFWPPASQVFDLLTSEDPNDLWPPSKTRGIIYSIRPTPTPNIRLVTYTLFWHNCLYKQFTRFLPFDLQGPQMTFDLHEKS